MFSVAFFSSAISVVVVPFLTRLIDDLKSIDVETEIKPN